MNPAANGAEGRDADESVQQSNPSLAVIVPMYNEEQGAEQCVRTVNRVVASLPTRTVLIVVNDGSTDTTRKILAALSAAEPALVVLDHERNQGYGGALRTGARYAASAGYEYVLFMDSDLTNDPGSLPAFLEKMRQGCDVIKASRYVRGGRVIGVPAWKVFVSAVGNRIARYLFGLPLTDSTNGFRALRTAIFCRLDITEPGFPSIMQEIYQAKSLTRSFCEVPCTLTVRPAGLRRSSFPYRPAVLYSYLKYPIQSFLGRRHPTSRTDG
jgi:dolichol-phosphate mannosyltransferase